MNPALNRIAAPIKIANAITLPPYFSHHSSSSFAFLNSLHVKVPAHESLMQLSVTTKVHGALLCHGRSGR
jgi:hypothetical protein